MVSHSTTDVDSRASRPLLSYGFRPFFLLAALSAIATVAVLFGGFVLGAWPAEALPLGRWHGHEMLFGFVAAAIAGFLLTAVPTWTNASPVTGAPLVGLALLWLVGRIVMSPILGVQGTALVLLDALFLPAVALAIGASLVRTRNYRNWPFLGILGLFTAANVVFLAAHLGWIAPLPFDPLRFAANLAQLMIGVIGGRIIPLFTRNALRNCGIQVSIAPFPWLDRATLAALVGVIAVDVLQPDRALAGSMALLAALLLAARLARWHGHRTLRMPIVWILHAGYGWLVVALVLKAFWTLGGAAWAANWLHALTAGAFGTMILGVMTRVALGHSGRPLEVAPAITAAYLLAIAGAALRIAGPALLPAHYVPVMGAAMIAWAGAFAIFLAVYLPILIAPRLDAR
jgi:uncharacterized protein involved in response to NO